MVGVTEVPLGNRKIMPHIDEFHKALQMYRDQNFTDAIPLFQKVGTVTCALHTRPL
jgi:hypothetical protein